MKRRLAFPTILLAFLVAIISCGKGEDHADTAAQGTDLPPAGPLEPKHSVPDVPLTDLEGYPVQTAALLEGRDTILLFVSLGCEACEDLVRSWKGLRDQIPDDVQVLAIADDEPEYARKFAEEHGFPFPLYCDEKGRFTHRYKVNLFPTVVGVPSDGRIAFVGSAVSPEFTPAQAVELLRRTKAGREAGGEGP